MTQADYDAAMGGLPDDPPRKFSWPEVIGTLCTLAIWGTTAALFAGLPTN